MGLFNRVLSGLSQETGATESEIMMTCDSCGQEVSEDEIEGGQCEECRDSDYDGPKYCCGAIYEEGEDTCASCGEPL